MCRVIKAMLLFVVVASLLATSMGAPSPLPHPVPQWVVSPYGYGYPYYYNSYYYAAPAYVNFGFHDHHTNNSNATTATTTTKPETISNPPEGSAMLNTNRNILFKATVLALCVISLVHVFLFPLYEGRGVAPRTYGDFEQSLCTNNIKRRKIWRLSRCPQDGIVTIMQGGRLGNQMWEYASVWAVARRTGLEPYIPRCIKLKLDQIFEQMTVPAFEEIAHCPVEFNTFVKSIEEWTFTNQSIILPRYTLQPELVLTWVQDIVQEFRFRKKLRDKAQQTLTTFVRKLPPQQYTFVGVHVRRTDYIGYLQKKYGTTPVSAQFFTNAMNYYRHKYPNCLFIYVSDDPTWCFNQFGHLKDVFVASYKTKNTPAADLAIMSACNHTIFDYGTFGEWGSILAGGETVYNNMTQNIKKGTGRVMKNWIMMN